MSFDLGTYLGASYSSQLDSEVLEFQRRLDGAFDHFKALGGFNQEGGKKSSKKNSKKVSVDGWSGEVDFSSLVSSDLRKKLDEIDRRIESVKFDMDDLKDSLAKLPLPKTGNCDKSCKGARKSYNKKIKDLKKELLGKKSDRKSVLSEIKSRS